MTHPRRIVSAAAPLLVVLPGVFFAGAASAQQTAPPAAAPPVAVPAPAPPLAAQNAKDPQSSFEPRSGPGEGQKLMEKMVGEWDVVKSIFPNGKPPVRTKGTCRQMMVSEGRFLHSQFSFDDPVTKKTTTGVGILGYDPKTGLFTSVWLDSRSTAFSFRQSEGTFDGQQVILFGRSLDPNAPARRSRTVARLENDGNLLVHQQFTPTPDGKERIVMELRMTRSPKPAPAAQKTAAVAKPTR